MSAGSAAHLAAVRGLPRLRGSLPLPSYARPTLCPALTYTLRTQVKIFSWLVPLLLALRSQEAKCVAEREAWCGQVGSKASEGEAVRRIMAALSWLSPPRTPPRYLLHTHTPCILLCTPIPLSGLTPLVPLPAPSYTHALCILLCTPNPLSGPTPSYHSPLSPTHTRFAPMHTLWLSRPDFFRTALPVLAAFLVPAYPIPRYAANSKHINHQLRTVCTGAAGACL